MQEGEQIVYYGTKLEDLHGGDLMPYRKSAYGCGACQMLFMAYIDGLGGDKPVLWQCYVLPEISLLSYDLERLEHSGLVFAKVNTWEKVRDWGDLVPETEARAIYPFLKDLPYGD